MTGTTSESVMRLFVAAVFSPCHVLAVEQRTATERKMVKRETCPPKTDKPVCPVLQQLQRYAGAEFAEIRLCHWCRGEGAGMTMVYE
jgi:hypothetical protein